MYGVGHCTTKICSCLSSPDNLSTSWIHTPGCFHNRSRLGCLIFFSTDNTAPVGFIALFCLHSPLLLSFLLNYYFDLFLILFSSLFLNLFPSSKLPAAAIEAMKINSEFYLHFEAGGSANILLFFLLWCFRTCHLFIIWSCSTQLQFHLKIIWESKVQLAPLELSFQKI